MNSRIRMCTGKDCRKHKKRCASLSSKVSSCSELGTIKCQDICKGVVIVVDHDGDRFWMKKMGGKKARSNLRRFLADGHMTKSLKKRVVKVSVEQVRKAHESEEASTDDEKSAAKKATKAKIKSEPKEKKVAAKAHKSTKETDKDAK